MSTPVDFLSTPQHINQVGSNCETTASSLFDQLTRLRSYVATLEAAWLGAASTQFGATMARYDADTKMLVDALSQIGGGLHGNAANYEQAEAANTRQVGSAR